MSAMSSSSFDYSLQRVEQITRQAALQVDELVFRYGHLGVRDPEREILRAKIREVLRLWADEVWDCGGIAQELWTVIFMTDDGPVHWSYPCSHFQECFR